MKITPLILIAIIIPLTSLPTLIKAPPGGSGGGGSIGGGSRFVGGGTGTDFRNAGNDPYKKGGDNGYYKGGDNGYKRGEKPGKPPGGGDPGAAIVVIPKKPPVEVRKECEPAVQQCVTTHITGDRPTVPPRRGSCCTKLKNAVKCVCTFLTSKTPKLKNAANGVLRGCAYYKPICIKMEMPKTCKPWVVNCVNQHIYGRAGKPTYHGPCCNKFKNSRSCVIAFRNSPDPKLSESAIGVIHGCHFKG